MARGNNGQTLFSDGPDWRKFLDLVSKTKCVTPFKLFAYCLMPNHVHLLMEVIEVPLSTILQRILSGYSRYFNTRKNQTGHVFQGRYKAIFCSKNTYLLQLIRYIHLNPVKAGLARDPADWKWSSHDEFIGRSSKTVADWSWPLALFHEDPVRAKALYCEFLDARMDPDSGALETESDSNHEEGGHRVPTTMTASFRCESPKSGIQKPLEELAGEVAGMAGISLSSIRGDSRRHHLTPARRMLIKRALELGFSPAQLAEYLGRSVSAVYKNLSQDN